MNDIHISKLQKSYKLLREKIVYSFYFANLETTKIINHPISEDFFGYGVFCLLETN